MAGAGSHAERMENVVKYMERVKASLENRQPETYRRFLDVMGDYKSGRIGVAEVASGALFRDTPALILGFNLFLPKGYQIHLSDEQAADIEEPMRFVKAVRDGHPAKYREFLRIILDDYGRDRISIPEVASRVGALFRDSPDLIAGFNAMLPREHEIQVVDELELAARFVMDTFIYFYIMGRRV